MLEAGGERFREIHDQRQGKPLGGSGPGERRGGTSVPKQNNDNGIGEGRLKGQINMTC